MTMHRPSLALIAAAATLLVAGCTTPKVALPELGPRFKPANVYRAVQKLPPDFRRVAILPLTTHGEDLTDSAHLDLVQKILEEELRKTRRFETLSVTRMELSRWIGRRQVSASEPLPADFLARIRTNLVATAWSSYGSIR
jgi:hypothetical protein